MPFKEIEVPGGGRPTFNASETTLLVDPGVHLAFKNANSTGKCYLTTQRILWIASSPGVPGTALALNLRNVKEVQQSSRGTFKRKHFLVITALDDDTHVDVHLTMQDSTTCKKWLKHTQMAVIKATRAFKEAGKAAAAARTASNVSTSAVTSNTIGIAGRRRAREKAIEHQSNVTASAFESIHNLKLRAKEIVSMIEKFAKNPITNDDSSEGATDTDTKLQFQSLLQTVGIANPVLRTAYSGKGSAAMKAFEQELSMELAQFIQGPLAAAGGILLLTDVYCLYNRARGSSVISPEELVEACENWSQIPSVGSSMVLHTFPSGVKVIRQVNHTDAAVFERLEALLNSGDTPSVGAWQCISAIEVSAHMRVGLLIAEEYLLAAEANSLLVRDDTLRGLYFFKNVF